MKNIPTFLSSIFYFAFIDSFYHPILAISYIPAIAAIVAATNMIVIIITITIKLSSITIVIN